MVNPGHPSFACGTCKQRRIRCDAQRPTCQQCEKSRRVCLGYDLSVPASRTSHKDRKPHSRSHGSGHEPPSSRLVEASPTCSPVATLSAADLISFIDSSVLRDGPFDFNQSDWRDHLCQIGVQSGVNADESELKVLLSALEVIGTGLSLLRQPSQTLSGRRRRLLQYGKVTSALRAALSSASAGPALKLSVLMFSFYEMINGTDPYQPTWRTHLDGLLAMIEGGPRTSSAPCLLNQAIDVLRDESLLSSSLTSLSRPEDKAILLLLLCALKLRKISREKRDLFKCSTRPRKLDVQKLRTEVKKVHRNLGLIPKLMESARSSITYDIQQQQMRILQVITAKLLLGFGQRLQDDGTYRTSSEHCTLTRSISSTVGGIHDAAAAIISQEPASSDHISILPALSIMWPLYEASRCSGLPGDLRKAFLDTLWRIGQTGGIPKAMDLSHRESEHTESDLAVLDAILLTGAIFSSMHFPRNT